MPRASARSPSSVKEPALPDAGLAGQFDRSARGRREAVQGGVQRRDLGAATDQSGTVLAWAASSRSEDGPLGAAEDQGAATGTAPMSAPTGDGHVVGVPQFVIHHRHSADDCGAVFASFRGSQPVAHADGARVVPRRWATRSGGRSRQWTTTAALGLLPFFVAARSTATPVERSASPEPRGGSTP